MKMMMMITIIIIIIIIRQRWWWWWSIFFFCYFFLSILVFSEYLYSWDKNGWHTHKKKLMCVLFQWIDRSIHRNFFLSFLLLLLLFDGLHWHYLSFTCPCCCCCCDNIIFHLKWKKNSKEKYFFTIHIIYVIDASLIDPRILFCFVVVVFCDLNPTKRNPEESRICSIFNTH